MTRAYVRYTQHGQSREATAKRGTLLALYGAPDPVLKRAVSGRWNRLRLLVGGRIVGEMQMVAHMEAWHRMRDTEERLADR